eukprot:6368953-Heterocapsa_arctica.AAC.1
MRIDLEDDGDVLAGLVGYEDFALRAVLAHLAPRSSCGDELLELLPQLAHDLVAVSGFCSAVTPDPDLVFGLLGGAWLH